MNYVILDLEWNQPFSKESGEYRRFGAKIPFEIMQIGATRVDETGRAKDDFNAYIHLNLYKKLHPMVKKLTMISKEALAAGEEFPAAIQRFRQWCGEDFILMTWGSDDIPILCQNLRFYGLEEEWCLKWYNLQTIFNYQLGLDGSQKALPTAMQQFDIQPDEGQFHSAVEDTRYTAMVAARLDLARGVREYDEAERSYESPFGKKLAGQDLGSFDNLEQALASETARGSICPVCGAALPLAEEWVAVNRRRQVALVRCGRCGQSFLLDLKLLFLPEKRVALQRTLRRANERTAPLVEEKRQAAREAEEKAAQAAQKTEI